MSSDSWEEYLSQKLSPVRYRHSLSVAKTARELGKRWGIDPRKCYLAGLLHDIARDYYPERLLREAKAYGIVWEELEYELPVLLHGPVGAAIIREELGISDLEILQAVALHTTGDYPLSPLAKVIFLADYIEPGRKFPEAQIAREAAEGSLDMGVATAIKGILAYLLAEGQAIHPKALQLYNHYVHEGFYRS